MATNLKIDDKLLADALKLGGFKTKKEAVNKALEEFVQHKRQLQVLEMEGKIEYFDDYDYKKARRRRA
jgi:Arc/MetJ family transcription regulator